MPDRNAVATNAALTTPGQRARFHLLDFIREDGINHGDKAPKLAPLGLYQAKLILAGTGWVAPEPVVTSFVTGDAPRADRAAVTTTTPSAV